MPLEPSLTDIGEIPLARWVFAESHGREILWRELGLPKHCRILFNQPPSVVLPEANRPGDIDVLVCDAQSDNAFAFEGKRVKVKPDTFETNMPGKLHELRKGAGQANALYEMGLCQTYLIVFVVIDGRDRNGYNFIERGLTPGLIQSIYGSAKEIDLRPEVGLVAVEIVQPVDKPIEGTGSMGVRVVRRAIPRAQSPETNERLRNHVAKSKSFSWL